MKLLLFNLFILSFIMFVCGHSRQKRFMTYSPSAKTFMGLILSVPFSTFIPGLGPDARSLAKLNEIACKEYQNITDSWMIQPQYTEELKKIQMIFSYLQISAVVCQERLICQMSADPEAFFPLSQIILREIRKDNGPLVKDDNSLIWRFVRAMKVGLISTEDQCQEFYSKCTIHPDKILATPFLKMWKYVATKIGMEVFN